MAPIVCCEEDDLLSCQPVNLDTARLGTDNVTLPNGLELNFIRKEKEEGGRVFYYEATDGSVFTFTCEREDLDQQQQQKHTKARRICFGQGRSAGGEIMMMEYCGSAGHVWKVLNTAALEEVEPLDEDPDDTPSAEIQYMAAEDQNVDRNKLARYSIKFYYTKEFKETTPSVDGFIFQVIEETNQGYENSGVPLEAFPLCKELTSLAEVEDASKQLANFAALYPSVDMIRDTADAAVLLVSDLSACGIGYEKTLKSGRTLAVVSKSCALGYYSVGHELGHNIGLDHDDEHARAKPYAYGAGHLIDSGKAKNNKDFKGVRSIMAYASEGHKTRINYYSNPDVTYSKTNTKTGTEDENNALVLLKNRFLLSEVGDESSSKCHPVASQEEAADEEDYYEDIDLSDLALDTEEAEEEEQEEEGEEEVSPDDDHLAEDDSEED